MASIAEKSPLLARIERATVDLPTVEGRGVLVPGGYVLTAAHCIGCSTDCEFSGLMFALEEYFQPARTADGTELLLAVSFVDLVSDVAVLACPDNQRLWDEADAFEEWAERTEPVRLFDGILVPRGEPLPVFVYNLDRQWVLGSGRVFREGQPRLCIETKVEVKRGASGGPIVTDGGELVALVSTCPTTTNRMGDRGEVFSGAGPRPTFTLPARFLDTMRSDQG